MRVVWIVAVLGFSVTAFGQLKSPDERPREELPAMVDEDEEFVTPTDYVFNPIQAKYEIKVGDHYAKKGSHRAAVGRYLEATRWNPTSSEAYWKLARSREKLNQPAQALGAYKAFLGLEDSGTRAKQVRKRVTELESAVEKIPLTAREAEPSPASR